MQVPITFNHQFSDVTQKILEDLKSKLGIDSEITDGSVIKTAVVLEIEDNTPPNELISIGMYIEMMRKKYSY